MEGVPDENQLVSVDVLNEEGLDCAAASQPLGIEDEDRVPDRTLTGLSRCRVGKALDLVVITPLAAIGDDHQVDVGPQIRISLPNRGIAASARAVKPNSPQIIRQFVLERADQALDDPPLRSRERRGGEGICRLGLPHESEDRLRA